MLAVSTLACGGSDKGLVDVPGPTEIPPPSLDARPDGLARAFLELIVEGRYDKAHDYLSIDGQLENPRSMFIDGLTKALSLKSTKFSYENRAVESERVVGNSALVTVGDTKYPQANKWVWEFEKTTVGWKIRSLDLPPVCRYQAKQEYNGR